MNPDQLDEFGGAEVKEGHHMMALPSLTAVQVKPDVVTFDAVTPAGELVSVECARPIWHTAGHFLAPHPCAHLVQLHIFPDGQPRLAPGTVGPQPVRLLAFTVDPRTPEGAVCLAALGYAESFRNI